MIFTSIIYFLFLAGTVAVFYLLPSKYRNYFLILASAVFYMYVKVAYLFILIGLIISNYFIAISIGNETQHKIRRRYLYLSLCLNIGVLVFFKYLNFLIDNLFGISHLLGFEKHSFVLDIVLPLGLSYYTFQVIGYVLDVYRGAQKAEKNIFSFSLFILFFPKLLVGPIERAKHFLPQLARNISFNNDNLTEGGKRIAWGLFKKLVVADRISLYQAVIDADPRQQTGLTVLVVSILYTFQVYADFSGYSDIAIGSARLFGYNLMENFNRPLLAKSLSDFWRRWHISLSSWVNDYIFTPVLLQKRNWGNWGVLNALLISFIVIGIWHGATWNYVLFGVLQAMVLFYETVTKNIRNILSKKIPAGIYNSASMILTFLFVTFSLIIFRSPDFDKALTILKVIFQNTGGLFFDRPSTIIFILIGCLVMILFDLQKEFKIFRIPASVNNNWIVQNISYALLLIYILVAAVFDGGQFIYFAF